MKIIEDTVKKFEKFAKIEISAAIKELDGIDIEANRKHLQGLVYVNIVNRFDSLIDSLLLKFSVQDGPFKQKVLNETKEEAVFLKDVYDILLSDNPKSAVEQRVEGVTRARFLSLRHSAKLRILLASCFHWSDSDLDKPRVFTNNGSVFSETKRLKPYKVPDSVIGYSDWLYSRRNALVHGDTKKLADKDTLIMVKKFGVKPATSISLKISSIKSAARFYTDISKSFLSSQEAAREVSYL
jgi:hypothetical protein